MSEGLVGKKVTSKMAISLNIHDALNNIIAAQLPNYLKDNIFEVYGSIKGNYKDAENDISFVIPQCKLHFKNKKLENITLPDTINYVSDQCSSESIADLLDQASIKIPFDVINFVQAAQIANISTIIQNNISALGVNRLNEDSLRVVGSLISGQVKLKTTLSIVKETDAATIVKVVKAVTDGISFGCLIRFKKREITPYQTVFESNWAIEGNNSIKATQALVWVLENTPEILQTTEDLSRPVSALHYEIKEFIDNKKPLK